MDEAVLQSLPGAPTRVHEDTAAFPDTHPEFRADTVLLRVDADRRGHLANEPNVLVDVVTAAFGGPPTCENTSARADRVAAAHWLVGTRPVPPALEPLGRPEPGYVAEDTSVEATEVWQQLRAMPEDEATSRVAALRQAAVECRPGAGLI